MAIKFKGSETAGATPNIGERELAWNIADKKIYTADSLGNLVEFLGTDSKAQWGSITGSITAQTDLQGALASKENSLGNPANDGYILSSTTAGVRSWISAVLTDENVKISSTDTTSGYLANKIIDGNGITFSTVSGGNEQITMTADVYLTTIGGNLMPVFNDTNRSKTLTVETPNFLFSEARLNSTEWMSIGKATDALSGYIMPFNGTIVGISGHTSEADSQTIDLYIDTTSTLSVLTFTTTSEEHQINNSLNIDFTAGQKIRLRGGGGNVMQDTNIEIRVKWRT